MADPADKKAVSITVPSKDPKKDKEGDKKGDGSGTTLDGAGLDAGGGDKGGKKTKGGLKDVLEPEELSEEDKALKEGLELAVTRVDDAEPGIGECASVRSFARSGKIFRACRSEPCDQFSYVLE